MLVRALTRVWSWEHLEGQPSGPTTNNGILRALDDGLSRRLTDYARTLSIWFEYFPRDQFLINSFDELRRNPQAYCDQILGFLGVEESDRVYLPLDTRVNTTKVDRRMAPFHRYYLARRWLPMLNRLAEFLPEMPEVACWKSDLGQIVADGDSRWGRQASLLLARRGAIHDFGYKPASFSRAYLRAIKMRRNVTRHLTESC